MGVHKNRLTKVILMSTNNIDFYEDLFQLHCISIPEQKSIQPYHSLLVSYMYIQIKSPYTIHFVIV